MKTILVTGATGFVGSHILESLMNTPEVRVIAACRDASRLLPGFDGEIRAGDLTDSAYLDSLLDGVDVVCHAAAWTSLWGHERESTQYFLAPTMALLDKIQTSGVQRFLFVSTTSAAAPEDSANPMSVGIPCAYWPHLNNVIKIENRMRELTSDEQTMVTLRLGLFTGNRYGLGLLPILLPRLKTHLVPWVAGGRTAMPLVSGEDIGQAFALAATVERLSGYEAFNILGPEIPSVREVVTYICEREALPKPHFGVPFPAAFAFAWLMEKLDPVMPWEPLIVRSIVHLLRDTGASNDRAAEKLGYRPTVHWKDAVSAQIDEMRRKQTRPMSMARDLS